MIYLVRKFSFMFVFYQGLYYALLLPLLNQDRLLSPDPLDLSFVLYLNIYMTWLIIGSVWAQEQLEHKNNGYGFLRTLPIQDHEIVLSKFILVLLSVLIYLVAHMVWFNLNFEEEGILLAARNNLVLMGNFTLVIAGLIYLGFYRFGYHRFGKIAIFVWFLLIASPIPIRILLKNRFNIGSDEIVNALMAGNPLLFTSVGLMLFVGSAFLATKLKSRYAF